MYGSSVGVVMVVGSVLGLYVGCGVQVVFVVVILVMLVVVVIVLVSGFVDFEVSDYDMLLFQKLFKQDIGLYLFLFKKVLLQSCFSYCLQEFGLCGLVQYYCFIMSVEGVEECQCVIDFIIINEIYFFCEQGYFDFLKQDFLLCWCDCQYLCVWSVVSVIGEEVYLLVMLLDYYWFVGSWLIFGFDISMCVLCFVCCVFYLMVCGQNILCLYLCCYCLFGIGEYEGYFLVQVDLCVKVEFVQCNLIVLYEYDDGLYDLIFLCNVIIYFDCEIKLQVLCDVIVCLWLGGYLVVGYLELLYGMELDLLMYFFFIYWRLL